MKSKFKSFLVILIAITYLTLFGACHNDNNDILDLNIKNSSQTPVYSLDDITKALLLENYDTVTFSTKFVNLSMSTSSGFIGFFDMQGVMTQVSTKSIKSEDYDIIKISHKDFWDAKTRRVKITYYKYSKIILNEYESIDFLEAQGYIICGTSIIRVNLRNNSNY